MPTAFCYDGGIGPTGGGTCRSDRPGDLFAAALYSDDFGRSFAVSNKEEGGNECQAARLSNGTLILNQRTDGPQRQLSYSHDNGVTWTAPRPVALAGPGAGTCCGSTVFVADSQRATDAGGLLAFSGPDSASRKNMSIYTSANGGLSWEWAYQLGDPSLAGGYSSLAVINVRALHLFVCRPLVPAAHILTFSVRAGRAPTLASRTRAPTVGAGFCSSRR